LFGSFCEKLLTDRQANNDECITSLAEVNIVIHQMAAQSKVSDTQ